MIRFENLEIEGFLSIGELTVNLNCGNEVILIKGRNGSGKTTLISALLWVLYWKLPKNVKDVHPKSFLRGKSYKGTKVTITWESEKGIHKLTRCSDYRGMLDDGCKGGDRLIYLLNGDVTKQKKKSEIQKELEKDLGLSYPLFRNSVMFGQGVTRLIDETGPDKKKLFEEMFCLDYIPVAKEIAVNRKKEICKEWFKKRYEIDNLTNKKEDLYKWYKKYQEEEANDTEYRARRIDKLEQKQLAYKKELSSLEIPNYRPTKSEKKLAQLDKKRKYLTLEYGRRKRVLESLKNSKGLSSFINNLKDLATAGDVIGVIEKLNVFEEAIIFLTKFRKSENRIISRIQKIQSEKRLYNVAKKREEQLTKEIQLVIAEIRDIVNEPKKIKSASFKKEYRSIKRKLKEVTKEFEIIDNKYQDIEWVINDPLGNNGIKTYLFESSLEGLNNALEKYSQVLGFRIEFGVDLESTKKDFYTLIEMNGEVFDYNELSGGQKQLVNIAMAFAMQETLSYSKEINILFLDELFESLDKDNIDLVGELINEIAKNKTIFLITHQESFTVSNSKTWKVTMRDGLTLIH